MMNFRSLLICAAAFAISIASASAAERHAYEGAAFRSALESGKAILVHVTAPWCVECKAQKPIVAALTAQPEYKDLTIFDVDFDTQKEALRALNVQTQSTLVIYKNKAEMTRAVGITRRDAIEAVLKKAL
jgi:thiol:disulfide interchange protein